MALSIHALVDCRRVSSQGTVPVNRRLNAGGLLLGHRRHMTLVSVTLSMAFDCTVHVP